jgi:hypothetical protein
MSKAKKKPARKQPSRKKGPLLASAMVAGAKTLAENTQSQITRQEPKETPKETEPEATQLQPAYIHADGYIRASRQTGTRTVRAPVSVQFGDYEAEALHKLKRYFSDMGFAGRIVGTSSLVCMCMRIVGEILDDPEMAKELTPRLVENLCVRNGVQPPKHLRF